MTHVEDGIAYTGLGGSDDTSGSCNDCPTLFTGPYALLGATGHVRSTGHAVTTRFEVRTLTTRAGDQAYREELGAAVGVTVHNEPPL